MRSNKLNIVIKKLREHFPEPYDYKSNLSDAVDVLIATKLSQNTTDKSSFVAFTNLKKKFKSWEKVAEADLNEIIESIRVCGLANTKAKHIKDMLLSLKHRYGTLNLDFLKKFEDEKIYKAFLQYDGFGVKTISCMLIFALGRDACPVDTHVHRVLNRLGIVKTSSAGKTFEEIRNKIPEGMKYELHTNLIKFGRNICRAKFPLCRNCFLYNECEFEAKEFFRQRKLSQKTSENNFIILENI